MCLMRAIICVLLTLSLVGCAVSKNPNPMIRYAANTGASLAGPGLAAVCIAHTDKDAEQLGLIGLAAAAGGFVIGAVIGGTVGFFKWMANGFEDDDMARAEPLPEEILPPVKNDTYGDKL